MADKPKIMIKRRVPGTVTITFGDQAENHVGMQKLGKLADCGFSVEDVKKAEERFILAGCKTEYIDLKNLLKEENKVNFIGTAGILIVRGGVDVLLGNTVGWRGLFDEQVCLDWDKKAFMYGRVVNKHARYNLCYADYSQEPDYANGKGRIISYDKVPLLKLVHDVLPTFIGDKALDLTAEGNYYYDTSKTFIGAHGDSERKKVVALRLGESFPLHYQWFYKGKSISDKLSINLHGGDLYIMTEKAVGTDWKKSSIYTLRHSAGFDHVLNK